MCACTSFQLRIVCVRAQADDVKSRAIRKSLKHTHVDGIWPVTTASPSTCNVPQGKYGITYIMPVVLTASRAKNVTTPHLVTICFQHSFINASGYVLITTVSHWYQTGNYAFVMQQHTLKR